MNLFTYIGKSTCYNFDNHKENFKLSYSKYIGNQHLTSFIALYLYPIKMLISQFTLGSINLYSK